MVNMDETGTALQSNKTKSAETQMIQEFLNSKRPIARAFLWVLGVSALFFLVKTAWPRPPHYPLDFKFFWLAGEFWLHGEGPYGPAYVAAGKAAFPGYLINPFFYPPNWRLPASLLALFTPWQAATLWAFGSACALIGAARAAALIAQRLYTDIPFWPFFAVTLFAFANLTHAAEYAIIVGQMSPLLCLAFAGLLLNLFRPNMALSATWLTILFLKPQLSGPIAAAVIFIPALRKPLIIAIAATAALTAFGLGIEAPVARGQAFLSNLSAYAGDPANSPHYVSGLNFVLAKTIGVIFPSPVLLALAMVVSGTAGLLFRPVIVGSAEASSILLAFAAATALLVTTAHTYDFLLLAPAIVLIGKLKPTARIGAILGAFFFMRASTLGVGFKGAPFENSWSNIAFYDTAAAALLCITLGAVLIGFRASKLNGEQP